MALANERRNDGVSKLSSEDQEDLAAMDVAVDGVRAHIPAAPYILTVPQDEKTRYSHHYRVQAYQWLEHAPFERRDGEDSQYQTFIYYEPERSLYRLHNSQLPDTAAKPTTNGTTHTNSKDKTGTGANTPNAGPKKKISLDAYKKKQTGQTPEVTATNDLGRPAKKPAAKGPVKRLKEDEEVLAAVEEDLASQAAKEVAPPVDEKKDLKRKREEPSEETKEADKSNVQNDSPRNVDQPAIKKMKTTLLIEKVALNVLPPAIKPVSPEPHKTPEQAPLPPKVEVEDDALPPKVTPLPTRDPMEEDAPPPSKLSQPAQLSRDNHLSPTVSSVLMGLLPSHLSPTLSDNVGATLKAREHHRSLSRSSDKSLSKDATSRTLTPPPAIPAKKKSPAPRNGFRANSGSPAVRSDAEERGRPITSVPKRFQLSDAESEDDSEGITVGKKMSYPGQPQSESSRAKALKPVQRRPSDRKSLVVKLKIPKRLRSPLQQVLKMPPRPSKTISSPLESSTVSDARSRARTNSNTKGVAQKIKPPHHTNGAAKKGGAQQSSDRKRSRSDDPDESDAPQIKRNRAGKDDSKSRRDDPATPMQNNIPSPVSVQRPDSQPSPSNLRKDVLSIAMRREASTDSNMHTPNAASRSPAATLKDTSHEANGTLKPPSSQPSDKTPMQEAWENEHNRLQSVGRKLKHFVQAEKSEDTLSLAARMLLAVKAVESLLSFMLALVCTDEATLAAEPKKHASAGPWLSLQQYFGFVRKKCEAFPPLHGLACCLGVVFNAHSLELVVRSRSQSMSRDELLETQKMMQRAANEAETQLDTDVLSATFPQSWANRQKGMIVQSKLELGKSFAGPYKLPIGLQTSPLHAVRAGRAILSEWIEAQEDFDYQLQLQL